MNADLSDPVALLRWWHQYQTQVLKSEADFIRNGVLQDMFAMRRQLEASCQSMDNCQLAEIKRMYTLLENLSDRLDPPYLHDSLSLALQRVIQGWCAKIHLTTILPDTWEPDPLEHSRLLIQFADNLLQQIATADSLPEGFNLTLQCQSGIKKITFHVHYKELLPLSLTLKVSRSLQPFLNTFQLFTQGSYNHDVRLQSLTWVLRWNPNPIQRNTRSNINQ